MSSDKEEEESAVSITGAATNGTFEEMIPSPEALVSESFQPCPICSRTFNPKALERHINICQKVGSKKRTVFNAEKKRTEGMPDVPITSVSPIKKAASVKAEDEFNLCKFCGRKFGHKAFDRHVAWCEEKSRRMQNSPNKDIVALAKLHMRTNYRPKTPVRKDSNESVSRKETYVISTTAEPSRCTTSAIEAYVQENHPRCSSRNSSFRRKSSTNPSSSGISFLNTTDHTKQSEETQFIRAATGRGSIKRPAQTKASQLREIQQMKKNSVQESSKFNGPSPTPRAVVNPTVRARSRTPSYSSNYGYHHQPQNPGSRSSSYGGFHNNAFMSRSFNEKIGSNVIKPHVVRPLTNASSSASTSTSSSSHHRKDGIEMNGNYDHSAEYDPYQLAAVQMQELLFGSSGGAGSAGNNLKPSSNSAFQKYESSASSLSASPTKPKNNTTSSSSSSAFNIVEPRSSYSFASNAKVAKFCHECGNPFALPHIRFCC